MTHPDARPVLLFYCQHSVGLGDLVRSLALAGALARHFRVVVANGGPLPPGTRAPAGVEIVNLPAIGHDGDDELVSRNPSYSIEAAKQTRVDLLLAAVDDLEPAVVVIELFPFGRKKFAFELVPLLEACRRRAGTRPTVVCSLRDILVTNRRDQPAHDDRASRLANDLVDTVLVHCDPRFARLEETFRPLTPLRAPVHYTGFVTSPVVTAPEPAVQQRRVLVSAGGGMVGGPLFRAAVSAHREMKDRLGLTTCVVAGPFAPQPLWAWLQREAAYSPDLQVIRQVADLRGEMSRSAVSVSQCGYNTAMDILRVGTPALVVPFDEGREDEQTRRARRLEELGVVRTLPSSRLDQLAGAVAGVAGRSRGRPELDLAGAETAARIIHELAVDRTMAARAAP